MKKVGILAAMQIEAQKLLDELQDRTDRQVFGVTYSEGTLCGVPVVIAVSGEGKVNAAMTCEAMVLLFQPDILLNTGVAGTLSEKLGIGDIAIASDTVEHDYDVSALGYEKGYVFGPDRIHVPCSDEVVNLLKECAEEKHLRYAVGCIASGDQFIGEHGKKESIQKTFGAIACEMEGGAVGHVAAMNRVPFGVIRAISDGADGSAPENFGEFAEHAAETSVEITKNFLKRIAKT